MGNNDSTRYNRRNGRKSEEEKRLKRQSRFRAVCLILVAAVCVGVIGGRQLSKYLDRNGTYISIGDHNIKKAEFDYYYHTSYNNFLNTYGSYASYFGLDTSQPLDEQNYSDNLTWKDYFEEQAVDSLKAVYALSDTGHSEGYEDDVSDQVNETVTQIQDAAKENDQDVDAYVQQLYGEYATLDKVREYMTTSEYAQAYYQKVEDDTKVSEDEINDYYDKNKDEYDSVDYMMCEIKADIPEDETETSVETSGETDESGSVETAAETMSESESEAAEAAKEEQTKEAMAAAKIEANAMLGKVSDEQSFDEQYQEYADSSDLGTDPKHTGEKSSSISNQDVETWLFDSSRKDGDKTVIEDTDSNEYYVVMFLNRYLDQTKTVDFRHILIEPGAETDESSSESLSGTSSTQTVTVSDTGSDETSAGTSSTETQSSDSTSETGDGSDSQITADTVDQETVKSAASDTEAVSETESDTMSESESIAQSESIAESESESIAESESEDAAAESKAEDIYQEWKDGKADEDSFAELADKYSQDTGSNTNGGLYEQVSKGSMVTEVDDWLFDSSRKAGDTGIVHSTYGYHIMYYVGDDDPEWHVDIENTLRDEKMQDYMDDIEKNYDVKDSRHKLNYLKVQEEESETAGETSADTSAETIGETSVETSAETE